MTLHWRLVPDKATKTMIVRADTATDLVDGATRGDTDLSEDEFAECRRREIGLAYEEMLSAVPPLTAAQVDEMCRAMWPDHACWKATAEAILADHPGKRYLDICGQRAIDRKNMRRFLTTAFGATFEEDGR